jgi:ATP-dependent RNA helicase SUPV3L1/SUV3
MLLDSGGLLPRRAMLQPIAALTRDDRRALARLGIRLGALDLFVPGLLKPAAMEWRAALAAVRAGLAMPALPAPGAVVLDEAADPRGAELAFRRVGPRWLRVDLADRLAAQALAARAERKEELLDLQLVTSLGLDEAAVGRLLGELGFRRVDGAWRWRPRRRPPPAAQGPRAGNAFGALAEWKR